MQFAESAGYLERLEGVSSRLKMTEILVELYQEISPEEARPVSYLLMGRLAPRFVDLEFGLADKMVMRSLAVAYQIEAVEVLQAYKKLGDLGLVAVEESTRSTQSTQGGEKHEARSKKREKTERQKDQLSESKLSVLEVYERLKAIAEDGGEGSQERKVQGLAALLQSLDGRSGKYVVRMVLGKLRLGFSDKTVLDALSWMEKGDKSAREVLTQAYQKATDIGELAFLVKQFGIETAVERADVILGVPIEPALCSRLKTADEMFEKMGKLVAEPKFDGTRVQIHWRRVEGRRSRVEGDWVRSFTRNLKESTVMFPELHKIGEQLNADEVILDAEGIGVNPETQQLLLFQQTISRKRKHGIEVASKEVPIRFYVFDILYKDGASLIQKPLRERRKILELTVKPGMVLETDEQVMPRTPSELRSYHAGLLAQGLEGAVIKKVEGTYTPGRLGWNWVKFKEAEDSEAKLSDTVDAVVMGFWRGEGKRAQFGMGKLLLGVRGEGRDRDREAAVNRVEQDKQDKREDQSFISQPSTLPDRQVGLDPVFVTVSRLGTGMTEAQLVELREKLEKLVVDEQPAEYVVDKMHVPDFWVRPEMVLEVAGDELTVSKTHTAGLALRFPRLVRERVDKSVEQVTSMEELEGIRG